MSNLSKDINVPSAYQVYEIPSESNSNISDILRTTSNGHESVAGYQVVQSGDEKMTVCKPSRISKIIQTWWLVEIASLVMSLVALAAIVIILRRYDGQPLPNWPFRITLNTFLSLFATISKATLVLPGILLSVFLPYITDAHDHSLRSY